MKFLIIQENGRHEVSKHLRECNSLQRALQYHGELCDVWGLGHDNFDKKPDYNSYDVIINLENYDIGWVPDLSEYNKPIKLVWAIDSHCQGKEYYSNIFSKGKYTKILEATKYYVDKDRVWFPNCYDSDFITPILEIEKNTLVGFCGNYCNRKPLFDYLGEKISEFKLDMDVRGFNMIKTINSYKISFNKNIFCDINYRSFESLGCGTCLLTNYDDQYLELGFKDEETFITYKSKEEAVDKILYLKDNPNLIDSISQKGHEFVKKKHTFKNRAKSLINYVKQL
jgi:glycosyltransferase involved in cell wall biosynthesis